MDQGHAEFGAYQAKMVRAIATTVIYVETLG